MLLELWADITTSLELEVITERGALSGKDVLTEKLLEVAVSPAPGRIMLALTVTSLLSVLHLTKKLAAFVPFKIILETSVHGTARGEENVQDDPLEDKSNSIVTVAARAVASVSLNPSSEGALISKAPKKIFGSIVGNAACTENQFEVATSSVPLLGVVEIQT